MSAVVLRWVDDEQVDVEVDGEVIGNLNHDEHGWSGMQSGMDLVKAFARKLGAEVRTEGVPNL